MPRGSARCCLGTLLICRLCGLDSGVPGSARRTTRLVAFAGGPQFGGSRGLLRMTPQDALGAAHADATGNQWLPWPTILEGTSGPMWWASTFTAPSGIFSLVLMSDSPAYEPTSRLGSERRVLHASTTAYHEVSEFSDQGPSPRS